MDASRFTEPGL